MKWYAKESPGSGQGLVIEEETGRTVAVAYDAKDARLLAAASEMRAVLDEMMGIAMGYAWVLHTEKTLRADKRWRRAEEILKETAT